MSTLELETEQRGAGSNMNRPGKSSVAELGEMPEEIRVEIHSSGDIVKARQMGRILAGQLGFPGSEVTLITSAIAEIACNIVLYAKRGAISLAPLRFGRKQGVLIVARDEGPGIENLEQAMQYGYSSTNRPGVGLPGAKWLMDEFDITSEPGRGTTVTMKKWLS